jgi:hypothetical protein
MRVLYIIALTLIMASFASAQISVQPTTGSVSVGFSSTRATTRFTVVNNGAAAVKIAKVLTSCNCTTTEMESMEILPGGKSVLTANIDTTLKAGTSNEAVLIYEEGQKRATVLHIELSLPDIASLSAKELDWQIGEKAAAKPLAISLAPGLDGRIVRVQIPDLPYTTVVQKPKEDGSVQVLITPQQTNVNMLGTLTISITADVNVNGTRMLKTQQVMVPVSVLSPPTTKPSK